MILILWFLIQSGGFVNFFLPFIRDDERDKSDNVKASSSEESMRRRASSSNDSVLSESPSPSLQYAQITWTNVADLAESNNGSAILLNQTREVLETTV